MIIDYHKAVKLIKSGKLSNLVTRDFQPREYCGQADLTDENGMVYSVLLSRDSGELRELYKEKGSN